MHIARFFSRRSRMHIKFAAAVSGLVLASGMILAGAAPASAASGCFENSCTGKDPNATGCINTAITVGTFQIGVQGTLYLRYSTACDAAWAKIINAGIWPVKIWVHNTDSQYQFVTTGFGTGSGYTNMVQDGPGFQAQACTDQYGTNCTGWF